MVRVRRVCHFHVKLKAAYDPYVGSNITCLKTAGALTPLVLAVSALASSLPYSDTAQKAPTAELSTLQDEWADRLASARQDVDWREAWRNERERIWSPKAGGHRVYRGALPTASSADSATPPNTEAGDNSDLSSLWTGRALDFQPPSRLSHYASQGETWENLWGGWPDDQREDQNLNAFRGFHTMLQDAHASFDPLEPTPAPAPEPAYTVFLLSAAFAAALFSGRRFQLEAQHRHPSGC